MHTYACIFHMQSLHYICILTLLIIKGKCYKYKYKYVYVTLKNYITFKEKSGK